MYIIYICMCVRSDIWLYAYIYNGYEAPPSGPGATVEPGPLNPEGSLLELMLAYWTDNYWKHKYRCYLNYWIDNYWNLSNWFNIWYYHILSIFISDILIVSYSKGIKNSEQLFKVYLSLDCCLVSSLNKKHGPSCQARPRQVWSCKVHLFDAMITSFNIL